MKAIFKNISKFFFSFLCPIIMELVKVLSFLLRSGIFLILLSIFYAHYLLEVVEKFYAKNTYLALSQENIKSGKAIKSSCLHKLFNRIRKRNITYYLGCMIPFLMCSLTNFIKEVKSVHFKKTVVRSSVHSKI